MKFRTKIIPHCAMRLGELSEIERLPNLTFETPLLLLYTKRGCIPHLCKDVFKMLTTKKQFLLSSLPSTILMEKYVKQFNSLSEYISMQEYPLFFIIQDPAEFTEPSCSKKASVSVWSRQGRVSVTPDKYMDLVEAFKPDIYMTLCDGYTDINSSQKRISKAVDTSRKLFEKCLERHVKSDILKNKGFLGSVEGGYNLHARENSIMYMKDKPLLGYVIDGLHKNGIQTQNISIDSIKDIIQHTLNLIPSDKLRVMFGCWNSITVLDLVDLGIDIFDSSYAFLMTEEKKALVFLCDECEHDKSGDFIDLSDKRYSDNFDPICKLCKCLACTNHTKAYIHHLVETKELLGQVLLMIHNVHHYMEFFDSIRMHIKQGTFNEFRNKIRLRCSKNN